MPTANDFLAEATTEIGYTENPPGSNRTKFAAEAGHANGHPWCATFLVAIARRTGLRLPSESAYTPSMANGFKSAGAWHASPEPGDFAFFDFPDSKNRIQHVGVVESSTASTVTCIEGNTSAGSSGSQDNGGGVYRRTRSRQHVVGCGRPVYSVEDDMALSDEDKDWLRQLVQSQVDRAVKAAHVAAEARDPHWKRLFAYLSRQP